MKLKILFGITFISLFILSSCRKEDQLIDSASANIQFSADSISFDTVFTTIGSVTEYFKIYNPYKESIKVSSIRLAKGSSSQFRINIDGLPGNQTDLIIPPKDSLFGFVEVTVDPNNQNNPFFIEDEIEFFTNGNKSSIKLIAYGQNAIYFIPNEIRQNLPPYRIIAKENESITLTKDKPYVIYGYAVVDSAATLTIEAGAKIYFHNNGGLWVFKGGNIQVNGTQAMPVLFRGDRLEMAYDNIPGQWDRIWINEGSVDNNINYAIIENAFIGIQNEPLPFATTFQVNPNKLKLKNTIIRNASSFGLLGTLAQIEAENLLIYNCGQYNAAITGAGDYSFKHCTFANYWDQSQRETPLLYAQNFQGTASGTTIIGEPKIRVENSIVYGRVDTEWDFEIIDNGKIDFKFINSVLKTDKNITGDTNYVNVTKNPSGQLFENLNEKDFHLSSTSPAINIGNIGIGAQVPLDLDGVSRTSDAAPDAGCYEF